MKQIILIATFLLSGKLTAQDKIEPITNSNYKHHINIGYSWNLFNYLVVGLTGINNGIYDSKKDSYFYPFKEFGDYDFLKQKRLNTLVIGYSKSTKKNPNVNFGFSGTIDIFKDFGTYALESNTINTTQTTQAYSMMANAYYHYLKKSKWVDLYLGGDFGIMMIHSKTKDIDNDIKDGNTKAFPIGSFCPFGIRLKTRVSPYLQANIGSRGWVEGGIAFDF